RVESEQGTVYALKVTSRPLYEPRCLIPRYLRDQGIAAVVAPILTRSGTLWVQLSDWTVIVYPWISGESSLTGMTNEQWKQVGSIFQQIHQVQFSPGDFASLRKETFDPTEYVRWVRAFETQPGHLQDQGTSVWALRSSWVAHQSIIHTTLTSLEKLAGMLQSRPSPCVICHGDLHARNLIRNQAGQIFVIDWDEVRLAPKERDFLFVSPPHAEAFFQGYGHVEIDWVALTYFLWERVVQDLIECTHNVCFRNDWGEESRAEAVQAFNVILAEDNVRIQAAYQASIHLTL
ncbi:MAG TPA: aminoglycoside phosphotransferase family protein, partial [Ktedonobacteraceae bacterium]|nr:aminoglycoside phosphotransferase family protein [Ktedonobacteraceae bacterium]